jgi:beta-glucosidase
MALFFQCHVVWLPPGTSVCIASAEIYQKIIFLDLIQKVHSVVAFETRIIGAARTFSPNINIYTDPRFGRFQEGWGEDPYLTSHMAVAAVRGLQGEQDENGYYNTTVICTKFF